MDLVVADPDVEGMAAVLAELIRGNLERDPSRARLISSTVGTVNVRAPDADIAVGLEFAGGTLRIQGKPFSRAGIDISAQSETLMELSNVPLAFGLPDARTPEGRGVLAQILRGQVKVKGMLAHLILLTKFQRLLSVR